MPIKPAPAVLRAMEVLELLAGGPEAATLSEIARRTGQSKATCQSVLLALVQGGHVRRDPSSLAYSLGPGLIAFGVAAASNLQLPDGTRAEMEALARALGVTAVAAVASGTSLVIADAVDPPRPFHMALPVGQRVPFAPPLGAAFIAWASETEVEAWLARAPRPLSAAERHHLLDALAVVRRHGYSVTLDRPETRRFAEAFEEAATHPQSRMARSRRDELLGELTVEMLPVTLEPGRVHRLTQVSAPVFGSDGGVAMILLGSAVGLEASAGEVAAHGERISAAAGRLTRAYGGHGPVPVPRCDAPPSE